MPEKSYGEVDYVDFIDVKIESNKEYNEIIKLYSEALDHRETSGLSSSASVKSCKASS